MRKILAIAGAGLLRVSRDRKALLLLLLMPMLLIGILGLSLRELMAPEMIRPFDVIVVNEDQPFLPELPRGSAPLPALELGRTLVEEVLGSDRMQELIRTTLADDLTEAKAQVSAGKAAAAIHVPAGFSAAVALGQPARLSLYTDPGQPTQAEIVSQVLATFADEVTTGAMTAAGTRPARAEIPIATPEIRERQAGARAVGAMQYYAAAMAVMFMLMSAIQRAGAILQDRESGVLARQLISPTHRWEIAAGQTLTNALVIALQFLILLAGTTLLYGVDWGAWLPVLATGLAFALAAAGISTGAAAFLRDARAADGAVGLIGMIFGALSGSMFPLYLFPDGLLKVARLVPNYWALQSFLDQMAGLEAHRAWLPVAILCLTSLVTGALGAWRLATR